MTTIDIALTLTAPLHVAYPNNYDEDKKVSYTSKFPLMTTAGQIQYVPYYPANGFRGGLRRKAMAHVLKQLNKEGPVAGSLYLGLSCGAASASPDAKTPRSVEELLRVRQNVYMGLFGGGARMFQSAYRVSDMIPVIDSTVSAGLVPKTALAHGEDAAPVSDAKPWQITSMRNSIRIDDLFRVTDVGQILATVKDPNVSVAQHQVKSIDNTAARNEAKANNTEKVVKSTLANMMEFETIAPGVPFHVRFDLQHDAGDDKLGLLLLCLQDLFVENGFGGWVRCGFGKVNVNKITIDNEEDAPLIWENFYENSDRFTLPEQARHFTDAAVQALERLTMDEMIGFFTDFSAEEKEQKKTKSRAKAQATDTQDV